MGGFPLGAFAGGVSQGLQQGQEMRARQIAIQDQLRQRAAQEAASAYIQNLAMQGDGQPAPTAVPPQPAQPTPAVPAQGGAPMPQAPAAGPAPAMQQVPMPGATPMPGAGPAPAGPAMGGAPPPQAPAPRPAVPGAPSTPPGAAPAGAGGQLPNPAVSGTASPTGDVWADSKKTLQTVARGIAQANPGRKWKPGELMDAVNDVIKTMDGLNPMERIAAQAQIAGANAQYKYWDAMVRDYRQGQGQDQRKSAADQAHQDRQDAIAASMKRTKMMTDARIRAQSMSDSTRLQAAEISQAAQDDRLGKTLDFRQQALEEGLDEKEWAASLAAELKAQGMSDAFVNKLFSAQAGAGQSPTAPQRPTVGAVPAPPARRGRGTPAPVGGQGGKPIPATTMAQWAQVPAQNKAAAKQHLREQGYDVSGLR